MTHADDDEVDRRFAELVRAEFGADEPVGRGPSPDTSVPLAPRPTRPVASRRVTERSVDDPHDDSLDDLWLDDDVDYRDPDPTPTIWSGPAMAGVALSAAGLAMALLVAFNVISSRFAMWVSGAMFVAGLAVLMHLALRRSVDPDDQPGAQI